MKISAILDEMSERISLNAQLVQWPQPRFQNNYASPLFFNMKETSILTFSPIEFHLSPCNARNIKITINQSNPNLYFRPINSFAILYPVTGCYSFISFYSDRSNIRFTKTRISFQRIFRRDYLFTSWLGRLKATDKYETNYFKKSVINLCDKIHSDRIREQITRSLISQILLWFRMCVWKMRI